MGKPFFLYLGVRRREVGALPVVDERREQGGFFRFVKRITRTRRIQTDQSYARLIGNHVKIFVSHRKSHDGQRLLKDGLRCFARKVAQFVHVHTIVVRVHNDDAQRLDALARKCVVIQTVAVIVRPRIKHQIDRGRLVGRACIVLLDAGRQAGRHEGRQQQAYILFRLFHTSLVSMIKVSSSPVCRRRSPIRAVRCRRSRRGS